MSNQKSLFESSNHDGERSYRVPKTATKRCHSRTSFQAAAKLDMSDQKHRHMLIANSIVHRFPGCTSKEVHAYAEELYDVDGERIRKRLADVKNHMKTIQDDEERRRDGCKTWWPVGDQNG